MSIRDNVNKAKQLAKQYLLERKLWIESGRQLRKPELIKKIYEDHCQGCEFRQDNQCSICGCYVKPEGSIFNKIAWATTKCPHNPPFWQEAKEDEIYRPEGEELAELIKNDEDEPTIEEEVQESQPESQPEPPSRRRKCCGRR